jgi:hypothetical protein
VTFQILVDVAFSTDPGSTPGTWTDLSSRRRGTLDIRYGRRTETAQIPAGTCQVTFDNRDFVLDPHSTTSPHYPNIIPMRQIRVRAVHNLVTYPLFYGFIEGWTPLRPSPSDHMVEVRAVDGFKWLGLHEQDLDLPRQKSGARINDLLDLVGWPAGQRNIQPGQVTLEPVEKVGGRILRQLWDTADSEDGQFYIGPDGTAIFQDRHHRLDLDGTMTPTVTVDGFEYRETEPPVDDEHLFTSGRVELRDGSSFQYVEPSAEAKFGERVWKQYDPDLTAVEADTLAAWAVVRWSQPHARIDHLALDAAVALPKLAPRNLGDLVGVSWPGSTVNAVLEQVRHRIRGVRWETTWSLSPWHGEGPWLIWDTAGSHWDDAKWTP